MLFKEIQIRNFLSFGPKAPSVPLGPLNVLIGPNGSGKSNFVEALTFLRGLTGDIAATARDAGGINFLVNRNSKLDQFSLGCAVSGEISVFGDPKETYVYRNEVAAYGSISLRSEEFFLRDDSKGPVGIPIASRSGDSIIRYKKDGKEEQRIPPSVASSSMLSMTLIDSFVMAEFSGELKAARFFRNHVFGRLMPARNPQPADAPNEFLSEGFSNLGLILSAIRQKPKAKRLLIEHLKKAYNSVTDYNVLIEGNTVQIFLEEGDHTVPATRLSDGTLQYLCLLAILCHPSPPALVCIEEPEIGLHPDLLRNIAELLVDASQRTQLVVTTHSPMLVDALSDHPEAIVVCEKVDDETRMTRLDPEALKDWLKDYQLGDLWMSGRIGGTRW